MKKRYLLFTAVGLTLCLSLAGAHVKDLWNQIRALENQRIRTYEKVAAHSNEQNLQRLLIIQLSKDISKLTSDLQKILSGCEKSANPGTCLQSLDRVQFQISRQVQNLKLYLRGDQHLARAQARVNGYPATDTALRQSLKELEGLKTLVQTTRSQFLMKAIQYEKQNAKNQVDLKKTEAKARAHCAFGESKFLSELNQARRLHLEAKIKSAPALFFQAQTFLTAAEESLSRHQSLCPQSPVWKSAVHLAPLKKELSQRTSPTELSRLRNQLCRHQKVRTHPDLMDGCRRRIQSHDFLASLWEVSR